MLILYSTSSKGRENQNATYGNATKYRIIADRIPQTNPHTLTSPTMLIHAIVPVRVCEPTMRMRKRANITPVSSYPNRPQIRATASE